MEKEYQITKETCQKMIDERPNICSRCGRKLVPIETVDNSDHPTFWPGCLHGSDAGNYHGGTTQEVYDLAEKLICDGETPARYYNKFEYSKDANHREYWFGEQMSSMCDLIHRIEGMKTREPRKTKTEFLSDPNW